MDELQTHEEAEDTSRVLAPLFSVEDPRVDRNKIHPVAEILFLMLVASLTGVHSFRGAEEFAHDKLDWLRTFLPYDKGAPSHQTLGRVFAVLKPSAVVKAYTQLLANLFQRNEDEIIALDGKTLRRSYDKASGQTPFHILNAWAVESGLALGQLTVKAKTNEITAVPELLKLLDVSGATVTVDALNTQKENSKAIREAGADYSMQVKGNQKTLLETIKLEFDTRGPSDGSFKETQTVDKGHGRVETRTHRVLSAPPELAEMGWKDAAGIGMTISEVFRDGKDVESVSYHLLSFVDLPKYQRAARGHWGVENALHWSLDVVFGEDECRTRKSHAPENLSMVKKIALSILRNEKTSKKSVPIKMAKAARSESFLTQMLKSSLFK